MIRNIVALMLIALVVSCPIPGRAATNQLIASASQPKLTSIAVQVAENATRFVIGLSSSTPFRVAARSDPDRVEIDFPALAWSPAVAASGTGAGLITVYRQATLPEGGTRIVLETTGPVKIAGAGTGLAAPLQPTEFMLTLTSADGSPVDVPQTPKLVAFAPPVPQAKIAPARVVPPPLPEALPDTLADMHEALDVRPSRKPVHVRHVVAIDPGHGGIDPGTASADGVWEKTLTLQSGLALKAALEATGRYTVVMTRDEDRFVQLQDRVKLARAAGAELFVSLHCDAMEGRDAHGATIYTLSQNASDAVSDRLAEQENKSAAIGGVDLAKQDNGTAATLIDLSMRDSLNQSNRFAELLVTSFAERRIGLQELKPHRSAGFAVLKAADMPSVLIEMGYLSDLRDAEQLGNPRHQHEVAEAITAGVDKYFRVK